jgi:hypothetical protein
MNASAAAGEGRARITISRRRRRWGPAPTVSDGEERGGWWRRMRLASTEAKMQRKMVAFFFGKFYILDLLAGLR